MGNTATMFSVDHNGKSKFAIAQNVDSKTTLKVSLIYICLIFLLLLFYMFCICYHEFPVFFKPYIWECVCPIGTFLPSWAYFILISFLLISFFSQVSSEDGFADVAVGVDRKIGDNDVVSPSFHAKGNHFKLDWYKWWLHTNMFIDILFLTTTKKKNEYIFI